MLQVKAFIFNPFYENTYVVFDEISKEAVIIDCGCINELEQQRLESFISSNALKVTHLLNTHLHLDHQFGNFYASHKYGVLPEAHELEKPNVQAFEQQCMLFGIPQQMRNQPLGHLLSEGDIISVGNGVLRVLFVPGHSAGGICFYAETERWLFSGDALFKESIGRTDLPGGNQPLLLQGIGNKILTLPDDTIIFPGHGDQTTVEHERYNNPFL